MYYVSICLYLRRWNTVFPRLWLVLGTMLCLFGWKKNLLDKGLLAGIYAFCAVFLAFFIVVELLILSGMRKSLKEEECGYIIVLGAKVDGLRLTRALRQRLDAAALYLGRHSSARVIVSGGQGRDEMVTEAFAMSEYLAGRGIDRSRILKEERSTTTWENLILSRKILKEDQNGAPYGTVKVGIVTNNFHMYRARELAKRAGYGNVYTILAPVSRIMFVNYMTREFFGVLKMWMQSI
ncbi:MAG: YdcF family protein [Coprococcus sp.]|nr:YdcF family protein [Coprococcus sp.]